MSNHDFKVGDRVEYKYDIHSVSEFGTVTRIEGSKVWVDFDLDYSESYLRPEYTGETHLIFRVVDRPTTEVQPEPVVDKPVEPSYDYTSLFRNNPDLTAKAVHDLMLDVSIEEASKFLASLK